MDSFDNASSTPKEFSHIKGWGIDADPQNDPTYPMKHRTGEEHQGYSWDSPAQQPQNMEVLHSNERPNVTAVYGTARAPSGLSGWLRRLAFRFGEGSYGHWLPLILADRVNAVEGIVDDLVHLRVPNICAEKGMKAEWKYNRKAVVKKAAVATVVIGGATLLLSRKRRR